MNIPKLDERSHIRQDPKYRMIMILGDVSRPYVTKEDDGVLATKRGARLIIKKIEEMIESREILPRANFQTFPMSERWMMEVTGHHHNSPELNLVFIDMVLEEIHKILPKSTKIETYEDEIHGVIHPISLARYCEPLLIADQSSESSEQL
jgi:hypothetical protein